MRICPPGPQSESFVFDLGGGDDLVDLSHAELTLPFVLPSTVSGGSGADEMRGGLRGDDFTGGSGNDTLVRLAGADRYLGGDGDDTLDLRTGGPWTVSLDGVINDGPASSPQANVGADVEVVLGGPLNDILGGTAGKQTLNGGGESDVLDGGPDGDSLSGEGGDDLILARDLSVDVISCGAGGDSVTTDWNDVVVGGRLRGRQSRYPRRRRRQVPARHRLR